MKGALFGCALPLVVWATPIDAAEPNAPILAAIDLLRKAALLRDSSAAAELLDEHLILISQSGKVYGKADALADLGSGFSAWENSEIRIVRDGDHAHASFVNARQRPDRDAASFRVLQLWRKRGKGWRLVAQSSTRIAAN